MPPFAAIANKELVSVAFETTLASGLLFERRHFQCLFATQDQTEGMTAFIEKRQGKWSDAYVSAAVRSELPRGDQKLFEAAFDHLKIDPKRGVVMSGEAR